MPLTLACPDENELLALAMGESCLAEVTAHVVGCPTCKATHERLQAEVVLLRANRPEMVVSLSTCPSPASEATAS